MTSHSTGRVRLRRRTLTGAAAAPLVLALLACGPGATGSPPAAPSLSPTITAAATPVTTTAVTAAPTQAGPAEPCSSGPGCAMPAGEYHASTLIGGMTFQLIGDGWTNVAYEPEILSLQSGANWVAFMSGEIRVGLGATEMTSDADDAQALIDEIRGITVTPADPGSIDGQEAIAFDIANTGNRTRQLWGMGATSGRYSLDPGASLRVYWVDRSGQPFLAAFEAPAASFDAFLTESQPILESIAFD